MTQSPNCNQLARLLQRLMKGGRSVQGQQRGQFFMGKGLGWLNGGHFPHQQFGLIRHLKPSQPGNRSGPLANDGGRNSAVFP